MKSKLLFIGLISFVQITYAQTTNRFPPDGNAGVGTLSPENAANWDKVFEVKGGYNSKIMTSTSLITTGLWAHNSGFFSGPTGGFSGTATNHPFSLVTNGLSRMTVSPEGKIGIGNSSPQDLLEIDAGAARQGLTLRGSGNSGVYNDIIFNNTNNASVPTGYPKGWAISHRQDGYFTGGDGSGSSLEFYSFNAGGGYFVPISFKSNGDLILVSNLKDAVSKNVGIGTTTPREKLSVNGKIRAWEIKVENTNWPDYVFKDEYVLPSLAETEKAIKENGHLPGIPTAAEVRENGVDLGEMNAKLLQKVEELTLHLIEKDKQIVEHQKADKILSSKLDSQQQQIDILMNQIKKVIRPELQELNAKTR